MSCSTSSISSYSSSIHSIPSTLTSTSNSNDSPTRGPRKLPSDPSRPFPFQVAQQEAQAKALALERERLRQERIDKEKLRNKFGPVEAFARHYKNQRPLPTTSGRGLNDDLNQTSNHRSPTSLEDLSISLADTRIDDRGFGNVRVPTLLLPGGRRGSDDSNNTATTSTISSSTSTPHLQPNYPYSQRNSSSTSISSSGSSRDGSGVKPLPSLPFARTASQLKHQTQNQSPYSSKEYLSKPTYYPNHQKEIRSQSQTSSGHHYPSNSSPTRSTNIRPLPTHPQQPAFGLPRPPILTEAPGSQAHARAQSESSSIHTRNRDRDRRGSSSEIDTDTQGSLGPIQLLAATYMKQNQYAPDLTDRDGVFRQSSTPLPHMPEPAVAPRSSDSEVGMNSWSNYGGSSRANSIDWNRAHSQSHSRQQSQGQMKMPIPTPIPISASDSNLRPLMPQPQLSKTTSILSDSIHRPIPIIPISRPHYLEESSSPATSISTASSYSNPPSTSFPLPTSFETNLSFGGLTPSSFVDTPSVYSVDSPDVSERRPSLFENAPDPCPNPWFKTSTPKLSSSTDLISTPPSTLIATPTSVLKAQTASSFSSEPTFKTSTPKLKPSTVTQLDSGLPPARNQCWGIKKDGKRCTRKVGNEGNGPSSPARGNRGSPAPKGKNSNQKARSKPRSKAKRKTQIINLVSDSEDEDEDQSFSLSIRSTSEYSGDEFEEEVVSKSSSRSSSPKKMKGSPIKVINIDGSESDPEEEEFEEDYCYQHAKEINLATGFYLSPANPSASTRSWIEFSNYIPTSLPPNLIARIRTNMISPLSSSDLSSDNKGYIYIYELRDRRLTTLNGDQFICLKVGRAKNVFKRMSEWRSQCQSKEPVLRYFAPETKDERDGKKDQVLMSGVGRTERVGIKGSHRWERLIHLNLAEWRVKEKCGDCGSVHQEIFLLPDDDGKGFERCRDEVRKWEEWERLCVGEEEDNNGTKGRKGRSWDLN